MGMSISASSSPVVRVAQPVIAPPPVAPKADVAPVAQSQALNTSGSLGTLLNTLA